MLFVTHSLYHLGELDDVLTSCCSVFHILGIYLFLSGFLLTRLVLDHKSECAVPPIELASSYAPGSYDTGCWHPKSFDKAVVIIVDALRYDFTVPFRPTYADDQPHYFHNAIPILHETATQQPNNAFLLPFIADPPTTTLQRLKGLTTGTLPTFIDAGSNFAGEAIDEDNLVTQLHNAGKRIVHLGDDTWLSLFPGYFQPDLSHAYDSFNVWDLHTVDNGVNKHLFPLLHSSNASSWDVIFGHYLGVDHAGHRYGPEHPAMTAKLRQMDDVFRHVIDVIDDKTLLVVMGDHGMDAKGDHGGESDDEVQAALWMYSKAGIFGRSDPAFIEPPATAEERPVGQIDLVPTLSLLLGMPVPFNNLGRPIEEAFVGKSGSDYQNLAEVNRLTDAQIHRYQDEYAAVRKLDKSASFPIEAQWYRAQHAWSFTRSNSKVSDKRWKVAYEAFAAYQAENLRVFRSLWTQFDLVSMSLGIAVLLCAFALLAVYAVGFAGDRVEIAPLLLGRGLVGTIFGAAVGYVASGLELPVLTSVAGFSAYGGLLGIVYAFWPLRNALRFPLPRTVWSWLCLICTALLCIGFASNSFTIWEDEILLYFLATFGVMMLFSSLGQADTKDRFLGTWNSISFMVLTRISSLSRLCREEQMPNCRSTYYSSVNSSTSASWQLIIPFIVALLLPSAIRDFYSRSKNYQASAVVWIGVALRIGLMMNAVFWVMDAADDGEWFPQISKGTLKSTRVLIAQVVLAGAYAAGYSTYIWASPFLAVRTEEAPAAPAPASQQLDPEDSTSPVFTPLKSPPKPKSKLLIMGYANTHGTRYFLLPVVWILALQLVQKPMGQGTLALCLISILNLLEIVDANDLRDSPVGPIVLALLGSYYFFKTGHQATLASIQWESAFIPLKTIQYPWSPLLVTLNTFGPQILCAVAVPTVVMWKVLPKQQGLLGQVAGAMATHILFYAAIALATVVEAAWLRRHLMLYRIFMPRMLMGVMVLLVVEVVGALVGLVGVRFSMTSVGEVFGWT